MIITPSKTSKNLSGRAYKKMCTGEGLSYKEWNRIKVECCKCNKIMLRSSIRQNYQRTHKTFDLHLQKYKEKINQDDKEEKNKEENDIDKTYTDKVTYNIDHPNIKRRIKCPIPFCPAELSDRNSLYRHFGYWHPKAKIIIKQDGEIPQCPLCNRYTKNIKQHNKTQECKTLSKRRTNDKINEENKNIKEEENIYINNQPLEKISNFKYLGRWLNTRDDDTLTIWENIKKARKKWGCLATVLKIEGASARIMSRFYFVILKSVLLYGAETWVITNKNVKNLEAFHNRCARHMCRQHIKLNKNGTWIYPSTKTVLEKCNMSPIRKYIKQQREKLKIFLITSEIWSKCMASKPPQTNISQIVWWNQNL